MILTPSQKVPNNVGNLGKIIVATGFEWFPKVQKIAQSGHSVCLKSNCQGSCKAVKVNQKIGKWFRKQFHVLWSNANSNIFN